MTSPRDRMRFGPLLGVLTSEAGLTLAELGRLCGVEPRTPPKWLGGVLPSAGAFVAILDAVGSSREDRIRLAVAYARASRTIPADDLSPEELRVAAEAVETIRASR